MLGPLPQPELDKSRAGVLSIAPVVLTDLLRLPPNTAVTDARIGPHGTIELLIIGKDMPRWPSEAQEPERVSLIAHAERLEPVGERITLSWAHLPGQKWMLR
jgi:hypothetical protein